MVIIFGGAFNPPTLAHYEIADKLIKRFKPDTFYFLPVGNRYKNKSMLDFDNRYKMVKIMADKLGAKVSTMENEESYRGTYYALLDLVDYSSLPKGKLSSLCADKRSPLTHAALSGFASCVEKMLMNGVSADDCQDGMTRPALHCMILAMADPSFRASNADEFAKCFNLILAKADINYINIGREDSVGGEGGRKRYRTPLVVALEDRLFPIATRLINEGADVNVCLYGQVNALGMFLREEGCNNDIVEYLVQAGAHVENDPEAKKLLKKYEKAWYWYQKKHP